MDKQLAHGNVAVDGVLLEPNKAGVKLERGEPTELPEPWNHRATLNLLIVGYIRAVGTRDTDCMLSRRRAASIAGCLFSRHRMRNNRRFPVGASRTSGRSR